ncbi:nitroreductase family protein [Cohnella algarum]|uniref:nitroreductase family protein n=1 Tax=Cohnella algarum TaxID=2044859 RepID=UPI0019670ED5|nr:nitroreductase family protein [Cohnella algarum]MBN2980825.1 nitroreductase family protein [Cohnella algarum]
MSVSSAAQSQASFESVIRERRSVRHYDASAQISEQELKDLLKEATLAPSSSNLQPWRFLVINDSEAKKRLLPIANNQQQVVEASAVIAVLGDRDAYKQSEKINRLAVEAGYMTEEFAATFTANSTKLYGALPSERREKIALIDGGLVSMQLMLAAKARGYDTVPMGGYNAEQLIAEFRIPDPYVPVMLIAVGKAATPGRPTSRLPVEDVTVWNTF